MSVSTKPLVTSLVIVLLTAGIITLALAFWYLRQGQDDAAAQLRIQEIISAHNRAAISSLEDRGEKTHKHADFKVYINGVAFGFTQAKYQSSKANPLDPDVHLHDGNGNVIHFHREKITLGDFFRTLEMELSSEPYQYFTTDDGKEYNGSFGVYVNGRLISESYEDEPSFEDYIPNDLDRILITVGGEVTQRALAEQITSVTSDACIYSETCPERGKPPVENCVGSVETGCD